jgi:hypothetical protein
VADDKEAFLEETPTQSLNGVNRSNQKKRAGRGDNVNRSKEVRNHEYLL